MAGAALPELEVSISWCCLDPLDTWNRNRGKRCHKHSSQGERFGGQKGQAERKVCLSVRAPANPLLKRGEAHPEG